MKFNATHITVMLCVVIISMTLLVLTGKIVISAHVAESFLVATAGFLSYIVGLLQRQPAWLTRVLRWRSGDEP